MKPSAQEANILGVRDTLTHDGTLAKDFNDEVTMHFIMGGRSLDRQE